MLFGIIGMQAQSLRELYVSMPDSLSPILSSVNRADFGDFLDSKMKAVVKNQLDSTSEMKQMSDRHLLLETTSASRLEMVLLPTSDSTKVICAISTYKGPAEDSEIRFYSTDWKRLPTARFIRIPEEMDFYKPEFAEQAATFIRQHQIFLKKVKINADLQTLTFEYTTPDFIGKEEAEKVKPYLLPPLQYVWNEGKFVPK